MPIINDLHAIHPIPRALQTHLNEVIVREEIKRKEYLLREGETCRKLYFIEKGLLRSCYTHEGLEICAWFGKERELFTEIKSFFNQQPTTENIQALEPSIVHSINYNSLQNIYDTFPTFNINMRVLTEQNNIFSEQKLVALRLKRANERYNWLKDNFPELILRVSAKYLASYLGITEVTLSVIKSSYRNL
jgi:CRP/FNR family transcriptional regulator, anaerobic regulatory protein